MHAHVSYDDVYICGREEEESGDKSTGDDSDNTLPPSTSSPPPPSAEEKKIDGDGPLLPGENEEEEGEEEGEEGEDKGDEGKREAGKGGKGEAPPSSAPLQFKVEMDLGLDTRWVVVCVRARPLHTHASFLTMGR